MNKAKGKDKINMGCRCYERLQPNTKEFTRLAYTELVLELEHLKIETRLITEMFANVMGECENQMRKHRGFYYESRKRERKLLGTLPGHEHPIIFFPRTADGFG